MCPANTSSQVIEHLFKDSNMHLSKWTYSELLCLYTCSIIIRIYIFIKMFQWFWMYDLVQRCDTCMIIELEVQWRKLCIESLKLYQQSMSLLQLDLNSSSVANGSSESSESNVVLANWSDPKIDSISPLISSLKLSPWNSCSSHVPLVLEISVKRPKAGGQRCNRLG